MNAPLTCQINQGLQRHLVWRMARIHDLLRRGCPVNCSIIARTIETSAKTALRDVNYMRDVLGLPIEYNPRTHCYSYTAPVSSALFGGVEQLSTPSAASGTLPALDEEPTGHLATICERHGLQAEDVVRAVLGESLAEAVCNPRFMDTIVRAARMFSMRGEEAA